MPDSDRNSCGDDKSSIHKNINSEDNASNETRAAEEPRQQTELYAGAV